MANEVNVFAIHPEELSQNTIEGVEQARFLFVPRFKRVQWPFTHWAALVQESDPELITEYIFEEPDGVRWLVSFRRQWAVLDDLRDRIIPQLADDALGEALTSSGRRIPSGWRDAPVTGALDNPAWHFYTLAEMQALAGAVDAALAADPDWASYGGSLSTEWRELAHAVRQAEEALFLWAYWD